MVHEDPDGNVREVKWGELQELSNRFANVLRAHGVERGDRVAMLLPPTPETAAAFFGTYKCGRDPALDVGALRRRRHQAPRQRLAGQGAGHQRGEQGPRRPVAGRARADPRRRAAAERRRLVRRGRHRGRRPGAALLLLRHHGAGEGHRPRAPLPARARGVRLLPRRAGRRALPRHGRVGVGGRHRAAARAVALRRGAARAAAQGRLRPAQAARLPLPPRGDATSSRRRPRCAR